mmetsp:Transcript_9762/g.14109  ORF Transcript_9762/g.14109 Transcript_9762/m.14109 type:complete len:85 (-) Transcript_9762:1659-1913(-)
MRCQSLQTTPRQIHCVDVAETFATDIKLSGFVEEFPIAILLVLNLTLGDSSTDDHLRLRRMILLSVETNSLELLYMLYRLSRSL